MSNKQLREVREWAQVMSYSQREPHWAWERYKDLVALIDEILASRAATIPLEDARRTDATWDIDRPGGENIVSIDSARRPAGELSARLSP